MSQEKTSRKSGKIQQQQEDWDEVHSQLLDIQKKDTGTGGADAVQDKTKENSTLGSSGGSTKSLRDYIKTEGHDEYRFGSISDALIIDTIEYESYKSGKWSLPDYKPGPLTEPQVLLACRLMLREMQHSAKKITFDIYAEQFAQQAIAQHSTFQTYQGMIGTGIVWGKSEVSDTPGVDTKSDFRKWAGDAAGGDIPPAIPADMYGLTFTLNCWEIIMYSAVKAGAINHDWLHKLYTFKTRKPLEYLTATWNSVLKARYPDAKDAETVKNHKAKTTQKDFADKLKAIMAIVNADQLLTDEWNKQVVALQTKINDINSNEATRELLGSGSELTYYNRKDKPDKNLENKKNLPLAGDIVFFDGYGHVAMATGNLSADGSPEIITFWPAPDQEQMEWKSVAGIRVASTPAIVDPADDRAFDKVKISSIQEMLNWGETRDKEISELTTRKTVVDQWADKAIAVLRGPMTNAEPAKLGPNPSKEDQKDYDDKLKLYTDELKIANEGGKKELLDLFSLMRVEMQYGITLTGPGQVKRDAILLKLGGLAGDLGTIIDVSDMLLIGMTVKEVKDLKDKSIKESGEHFFKKVTFRGAGWMNVIT